MTETEPDAAASSKYGAETFDPQDAILEKIDEMDSMENATFRVYRQNEGNTSKMDFLFTVPVDKYTAFDDLLSHIRDNYGGGDYRIHLRGPTETGRNQLIINKLFSIAEPKKEQSQQQQPSELSNVLNRVLDRVEKLEERLSNPAPAPQQADPFQAMERAVGMLGQMQGMMPQGAAQPTEKPKSLLEQMKELKELREMASELGGDGESKDGFSELVKTGLGPMMELMKEEANARKEAREQGRPAPQPNPARSSAPQQPTMEDMQNLDEGTKAMLGNVKTLLQAAQRGGDPETYAEIVLDFVPEDKYVQMYNFLVIPDCMETVIQYFPQVGEHRQWFETLRIGILEQLDADTEEGETPDDATGPSKSAAHSARPDESARDSAGEGGRSGDVTGHGEDGTGGEVAPSDP